jgi:hypothetical protein
MQIDIAVGAFSLSAATAATVLQIIAASTNKVKAGMVDRGGHKEPISLSFNGVSPTDQPVRVRILRQTNAIGGTPTTVTPVKHKKGEDGTIQTTAKKSAGGTEPTPDDVYFDEYFHPQGRHTIARQFEIEQGDRLGFEFTAPVAVSASLNVPCGE